MPENTDRTRLSRLVASLKSRPSLYAAGVAALMTMVTLIGVIVLTYLGNSKARFIDLPPLTWLALGLYLFLGSV